VKRVAVLQDAAAFGQFLLVPERFTLSFGVLEETAVVPVPATDAITIRARVEDHTLPRW